MKAVVHQELGDPARVLQVVTRPDPTELPPGSALVRVAMVPIHPADLQAASGSPSWGDPEVIPDGGRVPGLEGVGVITALADDVDSARGLSVGSRVAFFPVPGTWSEVVVAPVTALVPVPGEVSDEVAARVLIDSLTARVVVRAAHDALPLDERVAVTVLQTGASSAVGRLITAELIRRGVESIRLVRSHASAHRLNDRLPGQRVIATDDADWTHQARNALAGANARLLTVLDGVGGTQLGDVSRLLVPGGTVISYGSLGGADADIRSFVPRRLTLRGVSVLSWFDEPDAVRDADIAWAFDLASSDPGQFQVAATYRPAQVSDAIRQLGAPGRNGAVLLDFRS